MNSTLTNCKLARQWTLLSRTVLLLQNRRRGVASRQTELAVNCSRQFSVSQAEEQHQPQSNLRLSQYGFSLAELLISMFIVTMIVGTVLSLSNMGQARQAFEQDLVSVQQNTREAVDQMYRELRLAGFPQQSFYAASLGWTHDRLEWWRRQRDSIQQRHDQPELC